MAISWQTGEPPEGIELIARLRWPGAEKEFMHFADRLGDKWYVDGMEANGIEVLAWSTLDDDRAAKAMAFIEQNECDVTCDPRCAAKWDCENQDGSITGFSCTSALDAIEAAMAATAADQQTKGE